MIISSVKPSLKYSCSGSPVRFSKGSTASLIGAARRAADEPIPHAADIDADQQRRDDASSAAAARQPAPARRW